MIVGVDGHILCVVTLFTNFSAVNKLHVCMCVRARDVCGNDKLITRVFSAVQHIVFVRCARLGTSTQRTQHTSHVLTCVLCVCVGERGKRGGAPCDVC